MSHLLTNLYPHQKNAVEKLNKVKVGALFMDMGTGKTLCAFSLFDQRKKLNKVNKMVVLLPKSTEKNFIKEVEKHTDFMMNKDIYTFGLESISQSDAIYLKASRIVDEKTFLVIDESTYIKNHRALRTIRAIELSRKCHYKLIMTGTPITKYVKDLYSQFYFLSPKILGYETFNKFRDNHLEYDKNSGKIYKSHNIEWLNKKISPYIYEVDLLDIKEMPKRVRKMYTYYLNDDTVTAYNLEKFSFFKLDNDLPQTLLYAYLTNLQKVVLYDKNRVKILNDILKEIDSSKQVIIWCRFNQEIENIIEDLDEDYAIFNGTFKQQDEFISGKKRLLIANLQTGSHAHNFQNAHYQIFFSNSFDYATRLQAERRTWRIGQENKCVYIDIKSNAGIENMIFRCLDKKEDLLDKFLTLSKKYNRKDFENYLMKELAIIEDISRTERS